MSYVERLRVPLWWWLVALAFAASLALAILSFVPRMQGLIIVGLFALATALLVFAYGHTAIRVADGCVHVGRNSIEGRWIAGAEALSRVESADAMSAGADRQDFLVTRPYIGELVRITINDAADPHPHWLVSSRRPKELANAVTQISGGRA